MIADRERRKTVGEDGKAPKHDNMTPKYHGHDGGSGRCAETQTPTQPRSSTFSG